jgi:hypothetical protein
VSLTRPKHPARVGVVVVLVLIAINFAIFAGRNQVNGPPAATNRPTAIVQLIPDEGELQPPEAAVGAVLNSDDSAQLTIDGHLIPADQMTGDAGVGQFFFEPGPGKDFTTIPKGNANAVIEWWPKTISTPEAAKAQGRLASYSWSFRVG